ncbi:GNAT family N-acetyltransferase [Pseudonocardia spinosispora]|uniref:GNAT family N-acetyltransferase n=1 Tax=Pseudonocardia spinosispora TaxID=103441 RepID=UPI00040B4A7B|nr:GNAT family N-acetyltransferase [Pseudonocardia spinosispora]
MALSVLVEMALVRARWPPDPGGMMSRYDETTALQASNGWRVRPIERADFDQWLPLWDGYNAFYGRSGATALPTDVTRMTWARFLDAYEPVHALVAESGRELIGLAHYLFHRNTISLMPDCYLQDLFTIAPARGRGVGLGLITAVNERARTLGAARVYWHTQATNETARRLYDKVAELPGFVLYRQPLP